MTYLLPYCNPFSSESLKRPQSHPWYYLCYPPVCEQRLVAQTERWIRDELEMHKNMCIGRTCANVQTYLISCKTIRGVP